jgi:hypothetical protein
MPKKTFTPEQIVGKLRQVEVLMRQERARSQQLSAGRTRYYRLR